MKSIHNTIFARYLRPFAILTVSTTLLIASHADAGLKIYYMRHAEGGHNAVRYWSSVPKNERPEYVGNENTFTPRGKFEQAAVARKLSKFHFDFIAASSMWRARNTVLPYLKKNKLKSEIWPELHELRASKLILAPNLPTPSVKILGQGTTVNLPSDEAPWFTLRKDGLKEFKLPHLPRKHANQKAEAAATKVIMDEIVKMIQDRFGGSDKSILLVGHGSSGKTLLRVLTKNMLPNFPSITNTGIWMVEQQANGEFKIRMYNDVPIGDSN